MRVQSRRNVEAITTEKPWVRRAIPTEGAARTATCTADDGFSIRADLYGMGATLGEPHKLVVTVEPLWPLDDSDADPAERWPTMLEFLGGADELSPGVVYSIVLFANPSGVERIPVPLGTPRSMSGDQIGVLKGANEIELVQA